MQPTKLSDDDDDTPPAAQSTSVQNKTSKCKAKVSAYFSDAFIRLNFTKRSVVHGT
jgi:hypothetical protein